MKSSLLSSVGAMVLVFAVGGVASAVTLSESGDAGSLPGEAQTATGAVDLITGTLSSAGDDDMYRVCLTGGKSFSATTQGSEVLDPQLFLFDATGRGVYANDDFFGLQSNLPAGHALTPSAEGTYYLAIASFANRPVVSTGEPIFDFGPFAPIEGPFAPGGGSPLTDWNDNGSSTGTYRIALTGTRPCLPTSSDQCKNGGWRNFGVFKNQGDCVSFVATGGRNTPGVANP